MIVVPIAYRSRHHRGLAGGQRALSRAQLLVRSCDPIDTIAAVREMRHLAYEEDYLPAERRSCELLALCLHIPG